MFLAPRPSIFVAAFFFVCSAETSTPESTHVATYTLGGPTVDAPEKVAPGESFDVTVTVQNTGDTAWTQATYFDYIGDKEAGGVDLMLAADRVGRHVRALGCVRFRVADEDESRKEDGWSGDQHGDSVRAWRVWRAPSTVNEPP